MFPYKIFLLLALAQCGLSTFESIPPAPYNSLLQVTCITNSHGTFDDDNDDEPNTEVLCIKGMLFDNKAFTFMTVLDYDERRYLPAVRVVEGVDFIERERERERERDREREIKVFNAVQTAMVLFTARTNEEKEQI